MNMKEGSGAREIVVNPLTYYQKPAVGQDVSEDRTPVQLVFPSGGFGLGLYSKDVEEGKADGAEQETQHHGVLASVPLDTPLDNRQVKEYKAAFLGLAAANLVLTILMYFNVDRMDVSGVEAISGLLPSAFTKNAAHRRPVEDADFALLVLILSVGVISALSEHATGLSAFALAVLLNFFLGTAALPSFLYSLRYLLDFFLLYIALVLRSRLMCTFLVLNPHRL